VVNEECSYLFSGHPDLQSETHFTTSVVVLQQRFVALGVAGSRGESLLLLGGATLQHSSFPRESCVTCAARQAASVSPACWQSFGQREGIFQHKPGAGLNSLRAV